MKKSPQAPKSPKPSGGSITSFFSARPAGSEAPAPEVSLEDFLEQEEELLGGLNVPSDPPKSATKKRKTQTVIAGTSPAKRPKTKSDESKQLSLDFGQKETSYCSECDMLYSCSSETDREAHRVYHRIKTGRVKIPITTTMEVVYQDPSNSGRQIVLLSKKDEAKDKIKILLEVVDKELQLGSYAEKSLKEEKIFVFLVDGFGAGVLRVEKIQNAHRLIDPENELPLPVPSDNDLNSSISSTSTAASTAGDDVLRYRKRVEPATMGISRIWVRSEYKRQGIASTLLDIARAHFSFGTVVPKTACAMTQPTMEGRQFSVEYFGTRAYLVYETSAI